MIQNSINNQHYSLLIECCKITPNYENINNLVKKIKDWESLTYSAYSHGVFPLVYKALKLNSELPLELQKKLKQINFHTVQNNLLMTGELLKVLELLKSNSIRTLVIKGPVLSQMIHEDATIRQYSDLDLLISPSQMYRAVEILVENGYESEYDIDFLNNKMLLKVGKDFPVKHVHNNVLIEFHWKLFLDRYIQKSKINLFSDDNHHCMISKVSVETLEINAMLLYLLLHGSKHYWERIEWVVDIDRLISKYKTEIDWSLLKSMAKDMEIEFMFYLGLAVSRKLLGTTLKPSIDNYIEADKYLQKSLASILNNIHTDTIKESDSELVSFKTLNKIFMMKDKSNRWLRNYFNTLFQIKELDVYMVNLPRYLFPLYYFIRLYRLFKLNILKKK